MSRSFTPFVLGAALVLYLALPVHSLTNYANLFVRPDLIISGASNVTTFKAQKTILSWANQLAQSGPWSKFYPDIPEVLIQQSAQVLRTRTLRLHLGINTIT